MKNLKKLNRQNLKEINGGGLAECNVDADCGPLGCAWCTERKGGKYCLYSVNYPLCLDPNP